MMRAEISFPCPTDIKAAETAILLSAAFCQPVLCIWLYGIRRI